MPSLFERPYRSAAATELERSIREIEERDKKAQTKEKLAEAAASANSNINFAEKLNLITAQQAEDYRMRVEKAMEEQEQLKQAEHHRAEELENGRERSENQMTMEQVQAEINRERAAENVQRCQTQHSQSAPSPVKEDDDGSRTH